MGGYVGFVSLYDEMDNIREKHLDNLKYSHPFYNVLELGDIVVAMIKCIDHYQF